MDTEGLEDEEELLSDVETEVELGEEGPSTQTGSQKKNEDNQRLDTVMNKGGDGWNEEQGARRTDTDSSSEVDSSAHSVPEMHVEEEPGQESAEPDISSIPNVAKVAMSLEECIKYEENLVSNQVVSPMSNQMDMDGELSLRALEDAAAKILSKLDAFENFDMETRVHVEDEMRQSGTSLGKHLVARCFLNPEFDFSVGRANGSDAVSAINKQQKESMASKAWPHGVPDVVCWYKGVVAVGDSVGLIRVLHPGTLPR